MKKNGFTLIELLAVIIILGILMIIAIPSVTKYINDSRKSSYIDTAKEIASGARNLVNEGKLEMYDTTTTYYIPANCIKTENGGNAISPYGDFVKDRTYVVVTYDGQGYSYYWVSLDETGQGVSELKSIDELDIDDIKSDLKKEDIKDNMGVGGRSTVTIFNETCTGSIVKDAYKPPVCVKATKLHTDTCNLTSGGCFAAGYKDGNKGTTITFGSLPNSNELTPGDAYDCDVNGDGTYSSTTERFYYMRTIDENAAFISHANFEGASGQQNVNIFPYNDSFSYLPTIEQWSNLEITFDDNKAARFATMDDIKAACNLTNVTREGALDNCVFLMENSRFISSSTGRTAMWIKKEGNTLYRIQSNTRMIKNVNNDNTSAVRPVIEVPLDSIE